MGLIGNLAGKAAGAVAKKAAGAVAKKTGDIVETAVILKAGEMIEKKGQKRHDELMSEEFGNRKLMILRDMKHAGGRFEIYDDEGNYVYVAIGDLLAPTPRMTFYSPDGRELGGFKKKVFSFRSPLDRTQGENFDYEIVLKGEELGVFRNKTLGSKFGPLSEYKGEAGFTTLCYEFDYNGWELRNKATNLQMYIVDQDGENIAKIDRNLWKAGGYYVMSHYSREDELLYLILLLAYVTEHDERTPVEKVSDAGWHRRNG